MPELRQDPITLRWVAVSTERAKRPHTLSRPRPPGAVEQTVTCPFCPGHESETPPEVLAYRSPHSLPDTPGWRVRVVPNLYPAFGPATGDQSLRRSGAYSATNALGAHEVLISSPDHYEDIGKLPLAAVQDVVASYVERYNAHKDNTVVKYILIINNVGREAGASREHPHSQLFAIPHVPPTVVEELEGAETYRAEHGTCVYCDIVAHEDKAGERIIYENTEFLVFAPFASRTPFESWVIPRAHRPFFEAETPDDQRQFADALRTLIAKLGHGLNDPSFNYFIHTSPCHELRDGLYHWHLELWPRLSILGGFELGAGIMINTVLPEHAASYLRAVQVGDGL